MADNAIEYGSTYDQEVKTAIAKAIVNDVHEQGGRFLKKKKDADSWTIMKFDDARKSVSQALREPSRVMVRAIENA